MFLYFIAFSQHFSTFERIRDPFWHNLSFFGITVGGHGDHFYHLKWKRATLGSPLRFSPLSIHILGVILRSVFEHFPQKCVFSWCFFSCCFTLTFLCLFVYFMVSGTLKIRQNHWRVVQNQGSLENVKMSSEVASRVNFGVILKHLLAPKMHFL